MAAASLDALKALVSDRAVVRGRITLSSGAEYDYYFDCRRVVLSAEGAPLVGDAVVDVIKTLPELPRAVGGLTAGADPIITAATIKAGDAGIHLDGFYVRKEPKKHGTQQLIENPPPAGTRVVIVDDVVTKGGSIVQAIDAAEKAGCTVVGIIVLIDRLEGGADIVRARAPEAKYVPIFTLRDFLHIEEVARGYQVAK